MKRPGLSVLVLRDAVWPQVGEENVTFKRVGRTLELDEAGESETEKAAEKANSAQKDSGVETCLHVSCH